MPSMLIMLMPSAVRSALARPNCLNSKIVSSKTLVPIPAVIASAITSIGRLAATSGAPN